jgi:hypothetical protein
MTEIDGRGFWTRRIGPGPRLVSAGTHAACRQSGSERCGITFVQEIDSVKICRASLFDLE